MVVAAVQFYCCCFGGSRHHIPNARPSIQSMFRAPVKWAVEVKVGLYMIAAFCDEDRASGSSQRSTAWCSKKRATKSPKPKPTKAHMGLSDN